MIHTYSVKGMTCEACSAKVQALLERHADIVSARVSLDTDSVEVEMTEHLGIHTLQHLLGSEGEYLITQEAAANSQSDPPNASTLHAYKPLFLILAFITGVTTIAALQSADPFATVWMRYFMAGFFLVFSFFKFLDLPGFADSYANYDLLASRFKPYGFVYPFLEVALGVSYLVGFMPLATYLITIFLMGFSSIGVVQSVLDKRKIRCACLGTVIDLPMSTVTIIEDLLMVVMATAMLVIHLDLL